LWTKGKRQAPLDPREVECHHPDLSHKKGKQKVLGFPDALGLYIGDKNVKTSTISGTYRFSQGGRDGLKHH